MELILLYICFILVLGMSYTQGKVKANENEIRCLKRKKSELKFKIKVTDSMWDVDKVIEDFIKTKNVEAVDYKFNTLHLGGGVGLTHYIMVIYREKEMSE